MCEDRVPGGWRPGGPSLFSAVAAAKLGASVTLFGNAARDLPPLPASLRVVSQGGQPARYENTYDAEGNRRQLLLGRGSRVTPPRIAVGGAACLVAPAFHELLGPPAVREGTVVGLSLQGVLRATGPSGEVVHRTEAWRHVRPFAVPGAWAFLSEEDTSEPAALAARLVRAGVSVFVTRGYRGATCYGAFGERHFAAVAANPVDPTGAGDCFATAFLVRYAETQNLDIATRFALAAGALAVEGPGLAGVPDRAAIEARLERVAA